MFQANESLMYQLASKIGCNGSHNLTIVKCELKLDHVVYWVMNTDQREKDHNTMHQVRIKFK